jgi:hypothetical protein
VHAVILVMGMNDLEAERQESTGTGGVVNFLWQRRVWWLLPLAVLVLLVGILYVLGHMSSTDTEMYPTTYQSNSTNLHRA